MAVLSSILQVLPFPLAGPVPLWRTALCWIALVPLLQALLANDREGRPVDVLQATFLAYVTGIGFYLGNCSWIFATMHLYGGLPQPVAAGVLLLFCLYLGLYHALFGALVARLRQRLGPQRVLWFVPALWVAVELARARVTSFPWDLLGTAQVDNPLLTRLAPLAGAYGISFVIAAVNALWLARIRLRRRPYLRPLLVVAGCVLLAVYLVGLRHLPRASFAPMTATATLLQENLEVGAANVGPQETRDELLASFLKHSRNPARLELNGIPDLASTHLLSVPEYPYVRTAGSPGYRPTNLIVWPESPSGFRTDDPSFLRAAAELARTTHAPLVLGSLGVAPDATAERRVRIFDSAALFGADGTAAGRYDKIHLVPFGEYVPFKQILFFADRLTAGVGDMDRGSERSVFRTASGGDEHRFGVFVCYESIFGEEVRRFVLGGAEVLVNISDDGWYGDSGAPWQHLNMVRMRAIENHRWILRSTNTGITSAIDPAGRVVAALPRHIRAAMNVPFAYEHETTFYTRHGDWFAYLCAAVSLAGLVAATRVR